MLILALVELRGTNRRLVKQSKFTLQGIGRNYKIAKCAAAMQALKYIKVGNLKAAALQMNTNAIHNAMFK